MYYGGNTISNKDSNLNGSQKPKSVLLVGSPNVGKSLIFNKLTGMTAVVSNYPGTTVDIEKGKFSNGDVSFDIVDPPGMYDLNTITEEERISKLLILSGDFDLILHVVDAKNIDRSIDLTLQLIDAGKEVILALNMIDEIDKMGKKVDKNALSKYLGIPVVLTSATKNTGIDELKDTIFNYDAVKNKVLASSDGRVSVDYGQVLESAISKVASALKADYPMTKRSLAILLLEDDEDMKALIKEKESDYSSINSLLKKTKNSIGDPVKYLTKLRLSEYAEEIKIKYTTIGKTKAIEDNSWGERLSRAMTNPISGVIVLFLVLYFGVYQFVGVLGAGELVDFMESVVFGEYINPYATEVVEAIIPWEAIQNLFVGEYGIITLGITYGIAIIFPIVTLFFLVFSILEDSGYLPRLALLVDRLFKLIGLSGRSVIPLTLATGCGTMSLMVTRTLETKRERSIATLLMALTIPCSAQLGVIMAILSQHAVSLWIWLGVLVLTFMGTGLIAKTFLPGSQPDFYMELPPLRWPSIINIAKKTWTRLLMYLTELLPLFILISVIIWGLDLIGVFPILIDIMTFFTNAIGLPDAVAEPFVFGLFRRDYGAAGLLDESSWLSGVQLLVSAVVITLFLPCIAQLITMLRERGIRFGATVAVASLVVAFTVGFLLNIALAVLGVSY